MQQNDFQEVNGMYNFKIGLQLYSARDFMEKDVENTLKLVSEAGYEYVEFAGFFGYSSQDIKNLLKKYNLKCASVHQGFDDFAKRNQDSVNYLKDLGVKFVCIPWMDKINHIGGENFEKSISEITEAAKFLKENGIELLYHNHEFEFELYNDKFLLDQLIESVPDNLLKYQVDTCWVNFAGYEPVEYLTGLKDIAPVIHIKDYICKNITVENVSSRDINARKANKIKTHDECGFEFRPLGQGVMNIPGLLKAAEEIGTQYIIVEHDGVAQGMTQLEMAIEGRRYLKELGV